MPGVDNILRSFGEELKRAREGQRRSIDEMAARTRINRRYIEAIETGDLGSLPSGPYTSAFIREYSRALGCQVPEELAGISNSTQQDSHVSFRTIPARDRSNVKPTERSRSHTSRAQSQPPVEPETKPSSGAAEQLNAALRVTKETARIANQAAKSAARSAARTTETVIRRVETGAKDAVDAITSKSLWDEAEQVRKERRTGVEPDSVDTTKPQVVRASPDQAFDVRDIRETLSASETAPVEPVGHQAPKTNFDSQFRAGTPHSTLVNESDDEQETEPLEVSQGWWRSNPAGGSVSRGGLLSTTNLVIAGVVVLFGFVLAYALQLNKKDNASADLTTVQQSDVVRETPAQPASPTKKSAPEQVVPPTATASTQDSLTFVVHAIEPVWVSIAPDSRVPFRGELKAGETRHFTASQKFVVNLGNQKSLEMSLNGQSLSHLPTIQNSGVVVRDLVLTRDRVALGTTSASITSGSGEAPITTSRPSSTVSAKQPDHSQQSKGAASAGTRVRTNDRGVSTKPIKKAPAKRSSRRTPPQKHVKNLIPSVEPLPARP